MKEAAKYVGKVMFKLEFKFKKFSTLHKTTFATRC
jgi:hypothetical protein